MTDVDPELEPSSGSEEFEEEGEVVSVSKEVAHAADGSIGSDSGDATPDLDTTDDPDFVSLRIVSLNLCGRVPAASDLLTEVLCGTQPHDILVIGTQECERSIKQSFLRPGKQGWLQRVKESIPSEFVCVSTVTLTAIHLAIFVRRKFLRFLSEFELFSVACGGLNFFGNEGAVAVAFKFGRTPLLFIGAHLTHSVGNYLVRNGEYHRVIGTIGRKMRHRREFDVFTYFHHAFFFGDLNYRTRSEDATVREWVADGDRESILANDQLAVAKADELAWTEFSELPIDFMPTFKFIEETDDYIDSSTPSYCDRVLFRSLDDVLLDPLEYGAEHRYIVSDHHPVYAEFRLQVDTEGHDPNGAVDPFEETRAQERRRHKKNICTWF